MTGYGGYIDRLSRKVEARLSYIEAIYNFDLGTEFEIAMCLLLEDILPEKYGVCRGFIITEDGRSAGDDIIIYDKMSCPTLRSSKKSQYSLKEQIPVEAVYAYIECKHSIDDEVVLTKATEQIQTIKNHILSRKSKINSEYEENGPSYNGKVRDWPRTYPPRKNQPYCAIIAKHSNGLQSKTTFSGDYTPDLIILGSDYIATQSAKLGPDGIKGAIFFDPKFYSGLQVEHVKGQAFGLGLVLLLQALNWIELIPIDWQNTLNISFSDIVFGK